MSTRELTSSTERSTNKGLARLRRYAPSRQLHYGLVGFATYVYAIRFRGLNPTDVSWIFRDAIGDVAGFDSTANYLGWEFFRRGDLLTWPLGRSTLLGPESGSSIAMTDSLPLLGIPAKYLTWWIDRPLQYFGIWILLCFVLQAVVAGRILNRFISSHAAVLTAVTMFPLLPVYLSRIGVHTPLSGQWVVLAGIGLLLSERNIWWRWPLLVAIGVAVQPYLGAMVMLLCLSRLVGDACAQRRITKHIALIAGTAFTSAVATAHQVGLFVFGGGSLSAGGVGDFSANVMSLVDPLSDSSESHTVAWSRYLLLPNIEDRVYQYEGFGFVGTGVVLLALVASVITMYRVLTRKSALVIASLVIAASLLLSKIPSISLIALSGLLIALTVFVREHLHAVNQRIGFGVVVAVSVLLALSNVVVMGSYEFEYAWPSSVTEVFSIVRVTGRFVWVITYLSVLAAVIALAQLIRTRWLLIGVLVVCLVVQVADANYGIYRQRELLSGNRTPAGLSSALWSELADRYTTFSFVLPKPSPNLSNPNPGEDQSTLNDDFWLAKRVLWADLGEFAAYRGIRLNAFYFGRDPMNLYEREGADLARAVTRSDYRNDTLYVFIDSALWNEAKSKRRPQDVVGLLDGIPIVAPNLASCVTCTLVDVLPVKVAAN